MQYKEQNFQYEGDVPEFESEGAFEPIQRKQYRRGKPARSARRSKKPVAKPGPGIGARRNRRWSW